MSNSIDGIKPNRKSVSPQLLIGLSILNGLNLVLISRSGHSPWLRYATATVSVLIATVAVNLVRRMWKVASGLRGEQRNGLDYEL